MGTLVAAPELDPEAEGRELEIEVVMLGRPGAQS
jgi:hypothetical protein